MKKLLGVALACLSTPLIAVAQAVNPAPLAFDAENFLKPTADMHLGDASLVVCRPKNCLGEHRRRWLNRLKILLLPRAAAKRFGRCSYGWRLASIRLVIAPNTAMTEVPNR